MDNTEFLSGNFNLGNSKVDEPAEISRGSSVPFPSMGSRIKAVRDRWGWSQTQMAKALKVDQASISFWERDRIKPSGSAVVALASLFRTDVTTMVNGHGFVIPDEPHSEVLESRGPQIPRAVSLPSNCKGTVAIVNLADGSSKSDQSLSEGMTNLVQGAKESRHMWIVIE